MTEEPRPESITRGFLFADLRGYTDFVESHGAAAAASLLSRYRALARDAIARFGGAEIKTEGDSFYVVFNSVSSAVRCALAVAADAQTASAEHPDQPIRVGLGIHAGETVEEGGGYVGSPVNIAARICAQAQPGEVLVSETVRALTRTVLPVRFKSRGRRTLKGVADPIELFSVTEAAEDTAWTDAPRRRINRRARIGMIAGAAAVVLVAGGLGWWVLRASAGLPPGPWIIAVDVPLTGAFGSGGIQVRNAVQLAIDEANESGVLDGVELVLEAFDHVPPGEDLPSPDLGAENVTSIATDARTIAVVGPYNSDIAVEQIPITNEAGLLQCSPSTTDPNLTKPEFGALDVRSAQPDRINFIRLAPSLDVQLRAIAAFGTHDLEASSALVIADEFGIHEQFAEAFTSLGGQTFSSSFEMGGDPMAALEPLTTSGEPPDLVFYALGTDYGGAELRTAMADAGFGDTPYLSTDSVFDGPGTSEGSFIQLTGPAAVGTYIAAATLAPPAATFTDAYRAAFGDEPGTYTPAAYACAEVIIESLRALAGAGTSADDLREALRAYAVDPSHRYETALGTVGFDENGDSIQQFVTFYRVDPAAADGAGDWVPIKQQDFGSAS